LIELSQNGGRDVRRAGRADVAGNCAAYCITRTLSVRCAGDVLRQLGRRRRRLPRYLSPAAARAL